MAHPRSSQAYKRPDTYAGDKRSAYPRRRPANYVDKRSDNQRSSNYCDRRPDNPRPEPQQR